MTLFRMIVVLVGALAVLLCVAILRAETTRLHYEISARERRAAECCQQLREAELELARLRNPMLIRDQVQRVVRSIMEEEAPAPKPSPKRGRP